MKRTRSQKKASRAAHAAQVRHAQCVVAEREADREEARAWSALANTRALRLALSDTTVEEVILELARSTYAERNAETHAAWAALSSISAAQLSRMQEQRRRYLTWTVGVES